MQRGGMHDTIGEWPATATRGVPLWGQEVGGAAGGTEGTHHIYLNHIPLPVAGCQARKRLVGSLISCGFTKL